MGDQHSIFLDSVQGKYVEEAGGMNVAFVYQTLADIQHGRAPDPYGWMYRSAVASVG